MCGRFLNRTPASDMARIFGTTNPVPNFPPRYNLAPTEGVLGLRFNADDGKRHLDVLRWGLIPLDGEGPLDRQQAVQCARRGRVERRPSATPSPSAAASSPPTGSTNGRRASPARSPMPFVPAATRSLPLPGCGSAGAIPPRKRSCGAARSSPVAANALLAPIHDRMPVILDRARLGALAGRRIGEAARSAEAAEALPAERMRAYRIGQRINNVRNDDAALLEPE